MPPFLWRCKRFLEFFTHSQNNKNHIFNQIFKPSEQVSIFCIFQTGAVVSVRRSEREIDAKGFAACHSPEMFWNNWFFHSSCRRSNCLNFAKFLLFSNSLEAFDFFSGDSWLLLLLQRKEKRNIYAFDLEMHIFRRNWLHACMWQCFHASKHICML